MNLIQSSIAALLLLGAAGSANAGNGSPLATLRKQILAEAKATGILKGLVRPSLRVTREPNQTLKATIYSMSHSGPILATPRPLERLPFAEATFRITQTTQGKVATASPVDGQIWQHFLRALAEPKQ
jgi:hypothetical protein